ncbi:hypothetical protein [Cystobacter fuscus]|nr:hypothetical protein [Cystobacter fuscus]
MRSILPTIVLLHSVVIAVIGATPAHAQLETTLTIGAVSNALSNAITDFKSSLETVGGEVRGVGNSLQANAQNVISDIDRVFGRNVNLTFDRMDAQQRALYRDAQALTRQVRDATTALATKTGDELRRTIAEADISAYNISYSLPCRTQTPRIVYVATPRLRLGRDTPEITIRGNFLDWPAASEVTVDGTPARVIARSAGELRVAVPDAIVGAITAERSVALRVPAENRKRKIFLFCSTTKERLELQASATLVPRRQVSISAWIKPTTLVAETRKQLHNYDSGKSGDCDINTDVSQQVCAAEGWQVSDITHFAETGKNCGSNAGPPNVSGARCVHVPARLRGCGYRKYLGVKECKGRGWLSWDMSVGLTRDVRQDAQLQSFTVNAEGQSSWSFHYKPSENLRGPTWSYGARVQVAEGNKIEVYEVSQAQENAGPVSARLIDGTLAITLNDGSL